MTEDRLITAKEAAKLYGCGKSRIYQLAREKGGLSVYEKFGVMLFDRDEVIQMSKEKVPRRERKSVGIKKAAA